MRIKRPVIKTRSLVFSVRKDNVILLMEEIRLTTWDVQHPVNNGINYQLQLVSRISSINSITLPFQNKCWVQSLDISKTYWREVWRPFERPMFPDFMHVKWSKAVSFQLQLYTYSIHNCIYSYKHDEAYLCSHLQYIYISPGSPKTKLCPWVVGNLLYGSS